MNRTGKYWTFYLKRRNNLKKLNPAKFNVAVANAHFGTVTHAVSPDLEGHVFSIAILAGRKIDRLAVHEFRITVSPQIACIGKLAHQVSLGDFTIICSNHHSGFPGVMIYLRFGKIDFRRDDLDMEMLRQIVEAGSYYLELTPEGQKEFYVIGVN